MNGYYLSAIISKSEFGINEKINCHIRIFSEYFNMKRLEFPENKFLRKYIFKLPFTSSSRNYDQVFDFLENPRFIYIRSFPIEKKFILFLKKIKCTYPKCKILLEIPTYPYDKDEFNLWYNFFVLKKDQKYRKELYKFLDAIVTYSKDSYIFGCHTLNVSNGIDCDLIKPITNFKLDDKSIRLIGVAQLRLHHGFERLIKGLAIYYQKKKIGINVDFTIVGTGPEYQHYKNLVEQYKMQSHIKLVGPKQPSELIEYYDNSDIAISSLGFYKLGINYSSNLKNRDYIARGLPIVCCCDDSAFQNNKYVLIVSNDDSEISIDEIVNFYKKIYKNGKQKVVNEIRKLAYENVDIRKSYSQVIAFIKKYCI